MTTNGSTLRFRAGMVGVGMIVEETCWPFFAQAHGHPLYQRDFGPVEVDLAAQRDASRQNGLPAKRPWQNVAMRGPAVPTVFSEE